MGREGSARDARSKLIAGKMSFKKSEWKACVIAKRKLMNYLSLIPFLRFDF